MSSIWKDLLFLHGHFVRPEDLLDAAVDRASRTAAQREPVAATPAQQHDGDLACGGCA